MAEQLPVINKDKRSRDEFKQECFKVFQKYAEFFFGDGLLQKGKLAKSSAITIDQLTPVFQKAQGVKESIDWHRSLLENLFNETDSSPSPEDPAVA